MTQAEFNAGVAKQEQALQRKGLLHALAEEIKFKKAHIARLREQARNTNELANEWAEGLRKDELEMLTLSEGLEP